MVWMSVIANNFNHQFYMLASSQQKVFKSPLNISNTSLKLKYISMVDKSIAFSIDPLTAVFLVNYFMKTYLHYKS